jgi:hypothetical protein
VTLFALRTGLLDVLLRSVALHRPHSISGGDLGLARIL